MGSARGCAHTDLVVVSGCYDDEKSVEELVAWVVGCNLLVLGGGESREYLAEP
jgi:hypothetical protein